jgi:DNA-binding NtrC family response regulator
LSEENPDSDRFFNEWLREVSGPRPVLLVEDDPNDQELIERGSRDYNIDWYVAKNIDTAIKCLEKHGKIFRLVVMDLNLGDREHGKDLFRIIKQRWEWLPVLILSGHIDDQTIDECTTAGFVMFLKKPVKYDTRFFGQLFFAFNIPRKDADENKERKV